MSQKWFLVLLLSFSIFIAGCAPAATATQSADPILPSSPTPAAAALGTPQSSPVSGELVIYSGRSEPLIQPVIDAFQQQYPNVTVQLKAGSNSELANALLEETANPVADVFVTTELFTIQSLTAEGVFQSYRPQNADQLPAEFIGAGDQWVGLTRRARVIMYNTDLVSPEEVPQSIFDLSDPKWKGQIAAAGSTNGSMQAQIAAMRQIVGEEQTEAWVKGLLENDVEFFGGHTDVRKAVAAGEFKLGLVNHYYYYLQQAEGSPVGLVFPDQGDEQIGLITNATAAAIINGAGNLPAAQAFIDFLVSPEGQQLFAEENYEYPLLTGVALRPGVEPLDGKRFADVDVVKAALNYDETFELIERVGLP